jgi:hypothetical protein
VREREREREEAYKSSREPRERERKQRERKHRERERGSIQELIRGDIEQLQGAHQACFKIINKSINQLIKLINRI